MKHQSIKIILLTLFVVFELHAKTIKEGITYEIVEPDMLSEIEKKLTTVNVNALQKQFRIVNTTLHLPISKDDKIYYHTPVVTLPFDVTDNKSNIIYQKGFTYNPLKYTMLPHRLAIIGSVKQFNFLMSENKINEIDIVLVANIDTKEFIKKTNKRAFILTQEAITRLGIKSVPSVITQVNELFKIETYRLRSN